MAEPFLAVNDLHTYFFTEPGIIRAVDGVSFSVNRGEVLGLVGESGCGKSVTARSIIRLIPSPPGRIVRGNVTYDGRDLLALSDKQIRELRGNQIAMIFQEPMTSLNPVFTVGNQIMETIMLHQNLSLRQARTKGEDMLTQVGIASPGRRLKEYPHQLSGGMRQRVMIAMALCCEPDLLIADEPTTALDVTIQAQILELMIQLQERYGMAIILITHDLGVIAETADKIAVMYAGKIVERADVYTVFDKPAHPYTRGLIDSIPVIDQYSSGRTPLPAISGMVPHLLSLPPGCNFQDRCSYRFEPCLEVDPPLQEIESGHWVACHLHNPRAGAEAQQVSDHDPNR